MLIAQISDTHISQKGRKTLGVAPMDVNLARCVRHINGLDPQPDVVLVTGDITNAGGRLELEHAVELLGELKCPWHVVPGNHDRREDFHLIFDYPDRPSMPKPFFGYAIIEHDVLLIGLDSTKEGAPGGEICQTRADWLDEQLQTSKGRPVVIFMHHPPIKCGVLETDEDGFEGAKRLGEVIERYDNIERILCGHIHLLTHARWRGAIVSTAPSTGMQLGLDLTMQRESEFLLAYPGYLLHHWTPQNNLITHSIYVRDREGPFLFEEQ